jgi:hypothetical protein
MALIAFGSATRLTTRALYAVLYAGTTLYASIPDAYYRADAIAPAGRQPS